MRLLPLFAALALGASARAVGAPLCANRVVYVTAAAESEREITGRFLIVDSLPFEVRAVARGKGLVTLAVGYRWPSPQDRFAGPLSLELAERVRGILGKDIKKLKVKKIRAEYDPELGC